MCGISGYYSPSGLFNEGDLKNMNSSLHHRGPDAEGFFVDKIVGLAHKRLSIIDLSDRANQPMTSRNGRYIIIYNGEIYNFREIGALLKSATSHENQINFKTSSDTEIILEAFNHFGTDFVNHLNGMFAFAIYDKENEELYLFRDRIGIKPLYYYWDGKNFVFGSELKSIINTGKIGKEVNYFAIQDFLHLGYIPTPQSIYKNIFKLNSGSYLKINKYGIEHYKYWNIKNKIYSNIIRDKQKALVKLSDLLMSSVQYQLKSDVPMGVFLSGGIDSSLITAQAVELSSVKINTFSIGFEENTHNESQYAKAISKYLGTDHHEFIVSYDDAIDLVDKIFTAYDEPFGDSSAFPTLLVSKLAQKHVTVTLSGEGGDELFFGYGAYKWSRRLHNPWVRLFRKPLAAVFSQMPNRYKRISKMLNSHNDNNYLSHIFSQEQYLFSEGELKDLLKKQYTSMSYINEELFNRNFLSNFDENRYSNELVVKERKLSDMEMQALFDLMYYLPDDLLTKVDRASMQYSIETRVPYLDHRIVEFALNLSPELKYHNGVSKYILKEILYQYIPKKYFERPKQGFAIPLAIWLKGQLKYLIDDFLNEEVINKYGIVDYNIVSNIKKEFFNGTDYLYNRLWILIVLHKWLEMNNIDEEITKVNLVS